VGHQFEKPLNLYDTLSDQDGNLVPGLGAPGSAWKRCIAHLSSSSSVNCNGTILAFDGQKSTERNCQCPGQENSRQGSGLLWREGVLLAGVRVNDKLRPCRPRQI
jgi:hypothetical protein